MKKIYALYGDVYHEGPVEEAYLRAVFGEDMVFTSNPDEVPWDNMENEVLMYVSTKENNYTTKDGVLDSWITPEREKALYDYVQNGGKALFIHAGLVGYEPDSVYHKLSGGVFIQHPPLMNTTYVPVRNGHPITEGVENFSGMDEKYFCHIDVAEVDIFMHGDDPVHQGSIAGWCKEIGKGRTVAVTPGHTFEIAEDPNMIRLLKNSVQWLNKSL